MKRNKLVALIMAVVLAATLLAGCGTQSAAPSGSSGSSAPAGETQELNIAVFEGGYGSEYWIQVAKLFEESHPGVTVNVTANPKIGDIIRPNILAGNPPDFVYLSSVDSTGVTNAMIKDHALADVSDVAEKVKDTILPGFIENKNCQPYGDGKTYLMPMYYSTLGLWYNKTYFEENSLEVPTTWDEFFALGDKVKEIDGRALFTYQGIYPTYLESLVNPALAAGIGMDGIDKMINYEEGSYDNDAVRAVLNNIAKIGTDGYLMEGTVALDHTQAQSEWLMGKALFHPNGSWVEGEMKDAPREEGFKYGFCSAPALNADDDKYVNTQVEEMWIPAAAKNVELAKEFMAFQYSEEALKLNAELAHGVPPVKGTADYLNGQVSDAVLASYELFDEGYLPIIGTAFGVVSGTEISPRDEFYNQVGDVMSGKLTVDQWIEHMEDVCDQVRDKLVA